MAVTYYQRSTTSDLTGPTGTGGVDRHIVASRTAGGANTDLSTGNMNAGILCNHNFFTPSDDPGTEGTAGNFTVIVRITVQNANIGIRVFLRRYNSGGVGQGTEVEASQGSQTAGAASRTFTWTSPALGTWAAGDRLLIRVQHTNTSGSMNQSATVGVDTDADTVATPFTVGPVALDGVLHAVAEHTADLSIDRSLAGASDAVVEHVGVLQRRVTAASIGHSLEFRMTGGAAVTAGPRAAYANDFNETADITSLVEENWPSFDNTITKAIVGGEGEFTGSGGTSTSDRRLYLVPDVLVANAEVLVRLQRVAGGNAQGQVGVVARVDPRNGGPGAAPIAWTNVIFANDAAVIHGCWQYDATGFLHTNQTSPENHLYGPDIVTVNGDGANITAVCARPHRIPPGGHLFQFRAPNLTPAVDFQVNGTAVVVDDYTFRFAHTSTGSDATGAHIEWIWVPGRCWLSMRLHDRTMVTRYWLDGDEKPALGDTLRTKTVTLPATLASGSVALPRDRGRIGIVVAHMGSGAKAYYDNLSVVDLAVHAAGTWAFDFEATGTGTVTRQLDGVCEAVAEHVGDLTVTAPPPAGFTVTTVASATNSADTNHTVALPDGSNVVGRTLVVKVVADVPTTVGFPSGWTVDGQGATGVQLAVGRKIVDGTEGFPATGATIIVTTSAAMTSAHRSHLVAGAHVTSVPEVAYATGLGSTPDPPNLDPAGWAAEGNLWFAVVGTRFNEMVSAAPTNYTNLLTSNSTNGDNGTLATARRELNAAAENPGTFTIGSSMVWVTATIAVRPAPAVGGVALDGALEAVAEHIGDLVRVRAFDGSSDVVAEHAGDLIRDRGLTGAWDAVAEFAADLSIAGQVAFDGTLEAVAEHVGTIQLAAALTGASDAVADHAGFLDRVEALSGTSDAVAQLVAELTVTGELIPTVELDIIVGSTRLRSLIDTVDAGRETTPAVGATRLGYDLAATRSRSAAEISETRDRPLVTVESTRDRAQADIGPTRQGIQIGPTRDGQTP